MVLSPTFISMLCSKHRPVLIRLKKSKICYRGISRNQNLTSYLCTFDKRLQIKRLLGYYKAILEASLDAMITIDSSGNVIDFNNVVEDMFGWSYDEIISRT
jgi:PAS domain-containing protein